jgi:hypothetical protein
VFADLFLSEESSKKCIFAADYLCDELERGLLEMRGRSYSHDKSRQEAESIANEITTNEGAFGKYMYMSSRDPLLSRGSLLYSTNNHSGKRATLKPDNWDNGGQKVYAQLL